MSKKRNLSKTALRKIEEKKQLQREQSKMHLEKRKKTSARAGYAKRNRDRNLKIIANQPDFGW